jgi:hypothetical protein
MSRKAKPSSIDNDYQWLLSHLKEDCLQPRNELADSLSDFLSGRIQSGKLPYTVGVFGGWGSGKTTFLALLAKKLEATPNCRIIYFNAWKYAGFMEIVPALIYKILRLGVVDTEENRTKAAMRVLFSLGKEHADTFGEWAEQRVGVNPVNLFREVYGEFTKVESAAKFVNPKVVDAYYTQVDKAQDVLREVLGTVRDGERPENAVIVLIDELDRCDPDEAFNVIKQTRVLFAMRNMPVAFVVCANPEPIGLAIKHRYGLESEAGDYEARRILEKFVDSYEDLSGPIPLEPLVRRLWKAAPRKATPWVLAVDDEYDRPKYGIDVMRNAAGFDAMTTAIPLYSNLRVLLKSFNYVKDRNDVNELLLWTKWHLEIASQIDPRFRSELRRLASELEKLAASCYRSLATVPFVVEQTNRGKHLNYSTDKGRTLFAIFRSHFWEHARARLNKLDETMDPELRSQADVLRALLVDPRRTDFVILMCLLPFPRAVQPAKFAEGGPNGNLFDKDFGDGLHHQFAYLLANY